MNMWRFKAPILIVQGSLDFYTKLSRIKNLETTISSSDKTLKIIKGDYHEIYFDREKRQVFSYMFSWMQKRIPANGSYIRVKFPRELNVIVKFSTRWKKIAGILGAVLYVLAIYWLVKKASEQQEIGWKSAQTRPGPCSPAAEVTLGNNQSHWAAPG